MAALKVTTWHLEMAAPAQLLPPSRAVRGLEVREEMPGDRALVRRFYLAVGENYRWVDRRSWSAEQWSAWAAGTALTILVATLDGREAGFAVLDVQPGGEVEMAYFGLLEEFIGRGIGSAFLFETTRRAWALGARRVRLHTCSLDHPSALPGYRARGFKVYEVTEEERTDDDAVRARWSSSASGAARRGAECAAASTKGGARCGSTGTRSLTA